jgi:hypothetical protein
VPNGEPPSAKVNAGLAGSVVAPVGAVNPPGRQWRQGDQPSAIDQRELELTDAIEVRSPDGHSSLEIDHAGILGQPDGGAEQQLKPKSHSDNAVVPRTSRLERISSRRWSTALGEERVRESGHAQRISHSPEVKQPMGILDLNIRPDFNDRHVETTLARQAGTRGIRMDGLGQ